MTKEELEHEAEELIQRFEMANCKSRNLYWYLPLTPNRKQIGEMLVMIAEPREKRIAELIQEANKRYEDCQKIDDKQNKEILDLKVRIKELEKENAEAKKLIKNIIRVTWGEGWNYDLGWKVKAEQFINEKFDYLKKDFVNKSVDTNNIKC